jgi:hypothetical protein
LPHHSDSGLSLPVEPSGVASSPSLTRELNPFPKCLCICPMGRQPCRARGEPRQARVRRRGSKCVCVVPSRSPARSVGSWRRPNLVARLGPNPLQVSHPGALGGYLHRSRSHLSGPLGRVGVAGVLTCALSGGLAPAPCGVVGGLCLCPFDLVSDNSSASGANVHRSSDSFHSRHWRRLRSQTQKRALTSGYAGQGLV